MDQSGVIYRMPIFFCGLEPDLFGNAFRLLIQTMPQPIHYAQYLHLATRHETHLQSYLALNAQLSRFWRVLRVWFRDHDRGNKCRFRGLDSDLRRGRRVVKTCRRNGASTARLTRATYDSVREAGRGNFAHV